VARVAEGLPGLLRPRGGRELAGLRSEDWPSSGVPVPKPDRDVRRFSASAFRLLRRQPERSCPGAAPGRGGAAAAAATARHRRGDPGRSGAARAGPIRAERGSGVMEHLALRLTPDGSGPGKWKHAQASGGKGCRRPAEFTAVSARLLFGLPAQLVGEILEPVQCGIDRRDSPHRIADSCGDELGAAAELDPAVWREVFADHDA